MFYGWKDLFVNVLFDVNGERWIGFEVLWSVGVFWCWFWWWFVVGDDVGYDIIFVDCFFLGNIVEGDLYLRYGVGIGIFFWIFIELCVDSVFGDGNCLFMYFGGNVVKIFVDVGDWGFCFVFGENFVEEVLWDFFGECIVFMFMYV